MALDNLKNLIQNLEAFDFMREQEVIVEDNAGRIAELQAAQLYRGIDRLGNPITLDGYYGYAPSTIARKKKKGQVTSRVVWRDTGNFYKSLQGVVDNGEFTVTSLEGQYPIQAMIDRSGEETIGLTFESRSQFADEMLMPNFKEIFQRKTTLVIT